MSFILHCPVFLMRDASSKWNCASVSPSVRQSHFFFTNLLSIHLWRHHVSLLALVSLAGLVGFQILTLPAGYGLNFPSPKFGPFLLLIFLQALHSQLMFGQRHHLCTIWWFHLIWNALKLFFLMRNRINFEPCAITDDTTHVRNMFLIASVCVT